MVGHFTYNPTCAYRIDNDLEMDPPKAEQNLAFFQGQGEF